MTEVLLHDLGLLCESCFDLRSALCDRQSDDLDDNQVTTSGTVYSVDTRNKGSSHIQGESDPDGMRFHQATQNGTWCKTGELLSCGIFR